MSWTAFRCLHAVAIWTCPRGGQFLETAETRSSCWRVPGLLETCWSASQRWRSFWSHRSLSISCFWKTSLVASCTQSLQQATNPARRTNSLACDGETGVVCCPDPGPRNKQCDKVSPSWLFLGPNSGLFVLRSGPGPHGAGRLSV
ncbi:hypothetical protein CONLIGDRAFT_84963 [Coniochaeta ligniaria NRRL 30616]|uniref:Uncharacterized protein n=1 Tax=Coniochaeta ligniaria NRRL 30616 TaxID=1408157 RepID=A0A1J7IVS0_9PEZI|nr:hypothetical protein CONLIGDRAFT_84963 [Coniochaeta ligniaria NRRL 30616]